MIVDALSISQPWAWRILHRDKRIENRRWAPSQVAQARRVLGLRFALHAAKSFDESAAAEAPPRAELPAGAIVGAATLDRIITLAEARADATLADQVDWIAGPICLVLRDVVAIARPIPARGFLGFWAIPEDAAAELAAQLSTPPAAAPASR